jgi:hypothetical protein
MWVEKTICEPTNNFFFLLYESIKSFASSQLCNVIFLFTYVFAYWNQNNQLWNRNQKLVQFEIRFQISKVFGLFFILGLELEVMELV